VIAANVWATEAYEFEIAVPIANEDAPVINVFHIVRQINLGSADPGLEIRHTCEPAYVLRDEEVLSEGGRPIDMNLASRMHFKVDVEFRDEERWRFVPGPSPSGVWAEIKGRKGHYWIDSLAVTLDVSSLATDSSFARARKTHGPTLYDPVVDATIAAILDNASRSEPPLSSVRLRVVGPAPYPARSKLYPVTPRPVRPFDNATLPAYRKPSK
jgi:hypothetical protein